MKHFGLYRKLTDTDFLQSLQNFDIFFLSETWLSENHINVDIRNYSSIHVYGTKKKPGTKKGRLSGGLSVYYRQKLGKNISVIEKKK